MKHIVSAKLEGEGRVKVKFWDTSINSNRMQTLSILTISLGRLYSVVCLDPDLPGHVIGDACWEEADPSRE